MIGNRYSWGTTGYTILEEGEIDRQTLELRIRHYIVCRPDGEPLPQPFGSLDAARAAIEEIEAAQRDGRY